MIEKEKQQKEEEKPTFEQYQILERMYMYDSTISDDYSLKDRNEWMKEYWERERSQGIWNLITTLKIASLVVVDNIEVEIKDDLRMFLRCKEVLNEKNGVSGATIKEYLHEYTPLLTDGDYELVAEKYDDYKNNNPAKYRYGESNPGLQDENLLS